MAVDREQAKRNERARLVLRVRTAQVLQHRGHDGLPGARDETCVRCNADRAFDALLAELEQAEKERDEWLVPFLGDPVEWHESLPSPYTYQLGDFGALVAAVHSFEARAVAAEQREAALAEALKQAEEGVFSVHDVVWAPFAEWEGDNGRREPINAGLWKLHEILRAALAAYEASR